MCHHTVSFVEPLRPNSETKLSFGGYLVLSYVLSYGHDPPMQRLILGVLTALPLLLGAGNTPPQAPKVLLSRLRTEPVVAIDPVNPSVVVAGANTDYIAQPNGTFPVPYFTSHDRGRSFHAGTLPMPAPYTTWADASVAIARDGTVFYSYLAESPSYCSDGPGAILLAHSIDHGASFRGPVVVDSNPADDRPTLTVESITGKPSHLFLAWTRSYQDRNEIWFARSLDGGATFGPPNMVYSSPSANFGAQPVVGPAGHVYVFWLGHPNVAPAAVGPAQVLLAASQDDGARFSPVRGAGKSFTTLPQLGQPGSLRDLTTMSAAADSSGALYVAYATVRDRHANGSVDADIWLTRSLDHGTTWSAPERVNDVQRGDRFMPALSVLGDGTVGVAFYDRRSDPGELDVYAARVSFGRGVKATPNVRVNSAPSPVADISFFHKGNSCFPNGRFFGDYIGTAADGTMLGVVWADTELQRKNETDLWFARVALPFPVHRTRLSHHTSRVGGGITLAARTQSLLRWFAGIARHVPVRDLSRVQLVLLGVFLLLPVLAVVTALSSLRGTER
jgi:hypothetical protein